MNKSIANKLQKYEIKYKTSSDASKKNLYNEKIQFYKSMNSKVGGDNETIKLPEQNNNTENGPSVDEIITKLQNMGVTNKKNFEELHQKISETASNIGKAGENLIKAKDVEIEKKDSAVRELSGKVNELKSGINKIAAVVDKTVSESEQYLSTITPGSGMEKVIDVIANTNVNATDTIANANAIAKANANAISIANANAVNANANASSPGDTSIQPVKNNQAGGMMKVYNLNLE
jgi:hypothetical protein